jgi:WD40 repeat protein
VSQYSGYIASGHQDGKLRLWSTAGLSTSQTMKSIVSLSKEFGEVHDDSITSVLFQRHDSNKVLTYSTEGSMKLFDIRMEKTLKKFEEYTYM